MQKTQVWSLGWEGLPEKEMATTSRILAWKIPERQRSRAGYSPWGRKRVRHDLANSNEEQLIGTGAVEVLGLFCLPGLSQCLYRNASDCFEVWALQCFYTVCLYGFRICLDFQMCWRNAHHAPSPFTAPSVCSCVLLFFSYCSLVLSFFLVRRAPGLPVSYVFLQKPTCALLIFPIALLYPFSVSLISAFIFCYFLYPYFFLFLYLGLNREKETLFLLFFLLLKLCLWLYNI